MTSTICDLSDLPAEWCGCRHHKPEAATSYVPSLPLRRSTFAARYAGHCRACGNGIDVGDDLAYDDSERVVHAECAS